MISFDEVRKRADYQKFDFDNEGRIINVGPRMEKKLEAMSWLLPDFDGKTVLDIGCDFGFWSFLASERGAKEVHGIDRSRKVGSMGWIDIPALNSEIAERFTLHRNTKFSHFEAGKQYEVFPEDIVLCMSLYHHIFTNTGGDHESIWWWLWKNTKETLIWENPVDNRDRVVQMNMPPQIHDRYTYDQLIEAAEKYFTIEDERPALHEPYRFVWRLTPKAVDKREYNGLVYHGAGGASKAFEYENGRRIEEIKEAIGITPVPGSMNCLTDKVFHFEDRYFRTQIHDVVDRSKGLESEWALRPVRFYPVLVDGIQAYAMRFEGERYPTNMVELISDTRLRLHVSDEIQIWQ